MNFPYTDGLVEAKESNQSGWIQIDWLYPGTQPFKSVRTLFKIDKAVETEGFKGWLMWSPLANHNMHKHIMRWGGYPYAMDNQNVYFRKQVTLCAADQPT